MHNLMIKSTEYRRTYKEKIIEIIVIIEINIIMKADFRTHFV